MYVCICTNQGFPHCHDYVVTVRAVLCKLCLVSAVWLQAVSFGVEVILCLPNAMLLLQGCLQLLAARRSSHQMHRDAHCGASLLDCNWALQHTYFSTVWVHAISFSCGPCFVVISPIWLLWSAQCCWLVCFML